MSTRISIFDRGRPVKLDYEALLAYHGGAAVAGAAIGFRAMEAAGQALSSPQPWDRADLRATSWHNGPGVRDAIEFVTRSVTRGHFELRACDGPGNCAALAAFRFELRDAQRVVDVRLRDGIVPARFFELAALEQRSQEQTDELDRLKSTVAADVMRQPLDALFSISLKEVADA